MSDQRILGTLALVLSVACTDHATSRVDRSQQPTLATNASSGKTSGPDRMAALEVPVSWATPDGGVLPVTYLERLPVDPGHRLSFGETAQLRVLIRRAHEDSVRLYRQSYYLSATSPLGRLIRQNFPTVPVQEGSSYYLGDLSNYLESEGGAEQ